MVARLTLGDGSTLRFRADHPRNVRWRCARRWGRDAGALPPKALLSLYTDPVAPVARLVALIMLGLGATLTLVDFRRVVKHWKAPYVASASPIGRCTQADVPCGDCAADWSAFYRNSGSCLCSRSRSPRSWVCPI